MVFRREFCLVMVGLATLASTPVQAETWRTYQNDRFGTTVEFPDRFRPGVAPESADGLSFASADGARFSVFGSHNSAEQDIKALEAAVMDRREFGEKIVQRHGGANWFLISGTRGTVDFYERRVISHGGQIVNQFILTYPTRLRRTYEAIVARMERTFKPGRGEATPATP